MDLLLSVIAQIYDAAIDPTLWETALQQIAVFCDAANTVLIVEDAASPEQNLVYTSFKDLAGLAPYLHSFVFMRPPGSPPTDAASDARFLSESTYRRPSLARRYLARRRLIDVTAAILDETSTRFTILSALYEADRRPDEPTVRRKLQEMLPLMQRAVRIGQTYQRRSMQAKALADILDALESAVILVDDNGTILHTNLLADRLMREEAVARRVETRLSLGGPEAAKALDGFLTAAAAGGAPAQGTSVIPLVQDGSGKFVATIIPLKATSAARAGSGAVAAVCITEVAFDTSAARGAVGPLYGLTRRELASLFAIIDSGSVSAAAAQIGLAEATVQTHVKSIYRKTGAARHTDLVKLVAGASGQLRIPASTSTTQA